MSGKKRGRGRPNKYAFYGDINAKPAILYSEIVHQFPSMATADKKSMKKQISSVKAVVKNDAWKRIT